MSRYQETFPLTSLDANGSLEEGRGDLEGSGGSGLGPCDPGAFLW